MVAAPSSGALMRPGDYVHGDLTPHGMDLPDIKQLTVGADCTLTLKTDGEIKCYGTNGPNQLNGGMEPENGNEIYPSLR